jgi:hypothetical protein
MNFDRLYGPIMSSSKTGVSSSTMLPSALNPIVATLDVYTTLPTPSSRANFSSSRVPSTLDAYISCGSRTHSR